MREDPKLRPQSVAHDDIGVEAEMVGMMEPEVYVSFEPASATTLRIEFDFSSQLQDCLLVGRAAVCTLRSLYFTAILDNTPDDATSEKAAAIEFIDECLRMSPIPGQCRYGGAICGRGMERTAQHAVAAFLYGVAFVPDPFDLDANEFPPFRTSDRSATPALTHTQMSRVSMCIDLEPDPEDIDGEDHGYEGFDDDAFPEVDGLDASGVVSAAGRD